MVTIAAFFFTFLLIAIGAIDVFRSVHCSLDLSLIRIFSIISSLETKEELLIYGLLSLACLFM